MPPTTLSRRSFGRLAAGFAAASTLPWKGMEASPAAAGRPIRLSSNETPFGPAPSALEAIRTAFADAARYPDETAEELLVWPSR